MRTLGTEQTKVYTSNHRSQYVKVSVYLGAWCNMSDIEGHDFVKSVEVSDNIDSTTATARLTFHARQGFLSLWPLDEASKLNNLSGSYSPLVASTRQVKIETAVLPAGVTPLDADWENIFEGEMGPIESDVNTITVNCQDKGGALMRAFIETQHTYGSSTGVAVETEMQGILTDNSTGVTLYTPTSPSWNVKEWIQQKEPVLTALRRLAQQIGWDCKYRWDSGTSAWRLTLYQPERTKTTPDYTFSSDDNLIYGKTPSISDESIRNVVRVIYTDATGQTPTTVEVSDATSIADYGRRFMEIQEDAASNIDTGTEASTMANAILADLKDPILNLSVDASYLWWVETGDLLRFPADDVLWTSDTDMAVIGWTHTFADGPPKTTLQLQGKVTGFVNTWLQKEARPGIGRSYDQLGPIEKWRQTRYSLREGIGSFHLNKNSRRNSRIYNADFGHQSRAIAGSGWPPDGWDVITGTWGASGDVYVDDTLSVSGDRSLVYTSDSGAAAIIQTDFIPVTEGNTYYGSATCQTDNVTASTNVQITVSWYDSDKAYLSASTTLQYAFTSTGVWVTPHAIAVTAVANARFAKLTFSLTNTNGNSIWLDNVFFEEMNASAGAYDNAGSSISSGTWTVINLVAQTDYGNYYSEIDYSNDYLQKKRVGIYNYMAGVYFTTLTAGTEVAFEIQGSSDASSWTRVAWVHSVCGTSGDIKLNVNYVSIENDTYTYFRARVWHNYGSARSTVAGKTNTHLDGVQFKNML